MIKNKNLQTGLLVFLITLIGLITLAKFHPEDDLNTLENQSEITDNYAKEKLEIAEK